MDALGPGAADGSWDDAAPFTLAEDQGLFTVDFFTPIVDDPRDWGAIAAANAMSDIYAMGGEAVVAVAVAAWPESAPIDGLASALAAARAAFTSAGAALVGGHTITDASPKLGFAVVGSGAPRFKLDGGQPDDLLFLTKPLGTGVAATALRRNRCPAPVTAAVTASMRALNSAACRAARDLGLRCATDVTGFGLAGQLNRLCRASGVGATLDLRSIPVFAGVLELVPEHVTSIAGANREYVGPYLSIDSRDVVRAEMLFDPQTSGGLLLACPPSHSKELRRKLSSAQIQHSCVGVLTGDPEGRITVVDHGEAS